MYLLLMNPMSGRGMGVKLCDQITAVLKERGLSYCMETATLETQADEIAARHINDQLDGIIVVGGDGSLYQTVNRVRDNPAPLIIVPCGTGNDFVRALNFPRDPIQALKLQLDAQPRQIDEGRMNDIRFLNVGGTGFDVDVLRKTEQYKDRYTGLRAYFRGLVAAIRDYRPMQAKVSIDDGPAQDMRFAILSIGNGSYIGGGMKAVPDAEVDDGLFDVIIVKPVKKWMILPLIALFITGKHVRCGLGRRIRCKKIRMECPNMTVNLDGELLNTDCAEFEILPHALSIRAPK